MIMPTFEEELKRLMPTVLRLSSFALLGKKLLVKGAENFVREGGSVIVGNHIGTFKDVGALLKAVPRPIFFTANKDIFIYKDFNRLVLKHLRRHLKGLGPYINVLLKPLKILFVNYISSNVSKVGTIPVDMYSRKSLAIEKCQEYVKKGRAIIALQGRGRIMKRDPFPYVHPFRRGASIVAYNLYRNENISVPVTPIAFFGTHIAFGVPGTVYLRVGEPMFVRDYWVEDMAVTIERFRYALENRVKQMILEILRSR